MGRKFIYMKRTSCIFTEYIKEEQQTDICRCSIQTWGIVKQKQNVWQCRYICIDLFYSSISYMKQNSSCLSTQKMVKKKSEQQEHLWQNQILKDISLYSIGLFQKEWYLFIFVDILTLNFQFYSSWLLANIREKVKKYYVERKDNITTLFIYEQIYKLVESC